MADQQDRRKSAALKGRNLASDGRRFSPSTARNRQVIADVFVAQMPLKGSVLEIASGTGEHGAFLVASLPGLAWTYSDIDPSSMESQRAWAAHEGHDQLSGPYEVDARTEHWGEAEACAPYDAMVCINMIHISPFEATEGLFAGAARLLKPGGKLFLYGPYARQGQIAPSNAQFSEALKLRDASWGVRDLDLEIRPLATRHALVLQHVAEMPANNLSVIFKPE